MRDQLQELRELGLGRAAFRVGWEISSRLAPEAKAPPPRPSVPEGWTARLPFADPPSVSDALRDRVHPERRTALQEAAEGSLHGKVVCFGHWVGDYGDPIDWYRNPTTGARWSPERPARIALGEESRAGDVKLAWEAARFPQAYLVARAAAFQPSRAEAYARGLAAQMQAFVNATPYGRGIHWSSGQEIAVRLLAWTFAFDALLGRQGVQSELLLDALWSGAHHIEHGIAYAEHAVDNNHLLSEALGLYLAGTLLRGNETASHWQAKGRGILEAQAERQFYPDGAYLNLSHNYHRNVVQMLLWACALARVAGDRPSGAWLRAIDRSIDFLVTHQNPTDGRLPNFGPNDGSLPSPLSTCDFSDFRPTLQAATLLVRGERLYEPGPWDEEAAWWLGPGALDAPLRPPLRASRSFLHTGFHVLRGRDAGCFATLRCGSMLDRHGQMDMLHVDVWWRGLNVAVDGGSFLYNGPSAWHAHFDGTASHNTVTVDGLDQMLHWRRFKHLYWTRARLLAFEDAQSFAACAGEHDGYARHPGGCVHRRALAMWGDELVVVVDTLKGEGEHAARLHWLCGPYPHEQREDEARLILRTPAGAYTLAVFDGEGRIVKGSVVTGQDDPPRGWLSRYYGYNEPVPSLAVEAEAKLPHRWITVLGAGEVTLSRRGEVFSAVCGATRAAFGVRDGLIVGREEEPA